MQINNEQRETLIQSAMAVRHWAYVPYSHYPVGAAILTTSGKIYDGINVESAAFPTTMCAERVAIFKAVSVTDNAGSPCGACRQVMAEFGLETIVIIADANGNIREESTVSQLLPGAFTPKDLPTL
jgi:cytidine deaminase